MTVLRVLEEIKKINNLNTPTTSNNHTYLELDSEIQIRIPKTPKKQHKNKHKTSETSPSTQSPQTHKKLNNVIIISPDIELSNKYSILANPFQAKDTSRLNSPNHSEESPKTKPKRQINKSDKKQKK